MNVLLVVFFCLALLVTLVGLMRSSHTASTGISEQILLPRKHSSGNISHQQIMPDIHEGNVPQATKSQKTRAMEALSSDRERTTRVLGAIPPRATRSTRIIDSSEDGKTASYAMGPKSTRNLRALPARENNGAGNIYVGTIASMGITMPLAPRQRFRLNSFQSFFALAIVSFIASLYFLTAFVPQAAIFAPFLPGGRTLFQQTAPTPTSVATSAPVVYTATTTLQRLGQLDPAQYASTDEFNTWAYSACSAASMTEVINAYGHNYRITTILQQESKIHEITPELGLLEDVGIQRTAALFGFNTSWGHNLSLDQIIAIANQGQPVIVSWPPAKWTGGHILVIRGGNSSSVSLADSSSYNFTTMTRTRFLQLWGGFSAVLTPK